MPRKSSASSSAYRNCRCPTVHRPPERSPLNSPRKVGSEKKYRSALRFRLTPTGDTSSTYGNCRLRRDGWAEPPNLIYDCSDPLPRRRYAMLRPTLLWIVILSAVLTTLPCFGQTFGEITGVVTDSSGGLVVGATVTVTNPETGVTRTATTNTAGNYTFPSLLPGVYSVKSEMQGFQAEIRNGVELQVQQVARIDFQLKGGSM